MRSTFWKFFGERAVMILANIFACCVWSACFSASIVFRVSLSYISGAKACSKAGGLALHAKHIELCLT